MNSRKKPHRTVKSISELSTSAKPSICLTADDLLTNDLVMVEIPELPRDGKPGIVFLKPPSVRDVLSANQSSDISNEDRMMEILSLIVVNEHGAPIFTTDHLIRLRDMKMGVFARLSKAAAPLMAIASLDDSPLVQTETGESDLPIT